MALGPAPHPWCARRPWGCLWTPTCTTGTAVTQRPSTLEGRSGPVGGCARATTCLGHGSRQNPGGGAPLAAAAPAHAQPDGLRAAGRCWEDSRTGTSPNYCNLRRTPTRWPMTTSCCSTSTRSTRRVARGGVGERGAAEHQATKHDTLTWMQRVPQRPSCRFKPLCETSQTLYATSAPWHRLFSRATDTSLEQPGTLHNLVRICVAQAHGRGSHLVSVFAAH